jgi:hypothetical protein
MSMSINIHRVKKIETCGHTSEDDENTYRVQRFVVIYDEGTLEITLFSERGVTEIPLVCKDE